MVVTFGSIVDFTRSLQVKDGWDHLKVHLRKMTIRDAMISLGMEELHCSWLDIEDVLSGIEGWMNFALGVQAAYVRTVEIIGEELQKGYSTHDFDVDALIPTPGIMLVPIILERRKREVESAKIFYTSAGNRINVRNLKRTYYGKLLMRQMPFVRFTRRVSADEYSDIKKAMAGLGLKIQEPRQNRWIFKGPFIRW